MTDPYPPVTSPTEKYPPASSDSRFIMQTDQIPVVTNYSGALMVAYLNRDAIIVEITGERTPMLYQVKASSKGDRLYRASDVKVIG